MKDELQTTLRALLKSGSHDNPALNTLINDYARYHVVLVAEGGLLVLLFALLTVVFVKKFRRVPKTDKRTWSFEKLVYLAFGLLSSGVAALLALLVAVNATNAFDPQHGFALLVDSFSSPKVGAENVALRQAFTSWITSRRPTMPLLVQQQIQDRIAFHTTKALVSGLLLVVCVAVSILLWRALITQSSARAARWKPTEAILFGLGIVIGSGTVAFALLLLVIVVANMQGAFAPISLTLMNLYNP